MKICSILILLAFLCVNSIAQNVNEPTSQNPEWSQPYEPFRIAGNLYYVGTYDLACYLITTSEGNILINTGLAASLPIIENNISKLGFKMADTKILLTTQAHYDHVGAMAAIQQATGAKMFANKNDADALQDGGISDYELGQYGVTFAPVTVDRLLENNDIVKLGNVELTMLHHPGHTRGSCSYLLRVPDGKQFFSVLIVNLPSIITDRDFSAITDYPGIAIDYAATFESLKQLSFDLWVSSHASQFGLHQKHKPGDPYNPMKFADRPGYDQAVKQLETAFHQKMAGK